MVPPLEQFGAPQQVFRPVPFPERLSDRHYRNVNGLSPAQRGSESRRSMTSRTRRAIWALLLASVASAVASLVLSLLDYSRLTDSGVDIVGSLVILASGLAFAAIGALHAGQCRSAPS